jgi:hypothetical protein
MSDLLTSDAEVLKLRARLQAGSSPLVTRRFVVNPGLRHSVWLLVCLAVFGSGCASLLPYAPQPSRVHDPIQDFDVLVKQHWEYQPVSVTSSERYLTITWVWADSRRINSKTVMFDQLHHTRIWAFRGSFVVAAFNEQDAEQFSMTVPSKQAAEQLADILVALGQPPKDAKPSSRTPATQI